jgi:hypothetical protein
LRTLADSFIDNSGNAFSEREVMMSEHCKRDPGGNSHSEMLTTAEAADRLRYSSTASFRRAWRRANLPLFPQLGSGRWLVAVKDVERFLGPGAVDR